MHYAVNIADLTHATKHDPILAMLIEPHIDREQIVEADRGKVAGMGYAVVLTCPEEQVRAIVEVVRKRRKRHEFRFYVSATGTGGWSRI